MMPLLLTGLLLQAAPELVALEQPLAAPLGVAWDPSTGQVAVLHRDGNQLQILDFSLRPLQIQTFDVAQSGLQWQVQGWDFSGPLQNSVPGPAGRALLLSSSGQVAWGPATWEHDPRIEWGPGWATLRLRSAWLTQGSVEWRPKDPLQASPGVATLRPDPRDPLSLRCNLPGFVPGLFYEIRVSPMRPQFPRKRMGPWIPIQVPGVDPAGPRPQTWLRPISEGSLPIQPARLPSAEEE